MWNVSPEPLLNNQQQVSIVVPGHYRYSSNNGESPDETTCRTGHTSTGGHHQLLFRTQQQSPESCFGTATSRGKRRFQPWELLATWTTPEEEEEETDNRSIVSAKAHLLRRSDTSDALLRSVSSRRFLATERSSSQLLSQGSIIGPKLLTHGCGNCTTVVVNNNTRRPSEVFKPFVRGNGRYNIKRKWGFRDQLMDLWFRDGFHFLLSVRLPILLPTMFCAHIVWAAFLALLLALVTKFDVDRCLGGTVVGYSNFYFFTVETMFAIGFGSPRYPSCEEANWMVSFIVISTVLFNGLVLGIIFAKFSSATKRRWAIFFSSALVGSENQKKDNTTFSTGGSSRSAGDNLTFSFRIMNLTSQSFFNTELSLFLLTHGEEQIEISRVDTFYTDVPLEFMELPTTISICGKDLFCDISISELSDAAHRYELLALLSFTDNRTSRTIEIRKSWLLSETRWGMWFADVLCRSPDGTYSVNVNDLDLVEPIDEEDPPQTQRQEGQGQPPTQQPPPQGQPPTQQPPPEGQPPQQQQQQQPPPIKQHA